MKQKLLIFLCLSLLAISGIYAQTRTITGKITGKDDGLPLPGVSIRVKGSTTGVQSGVDGAYSINVGSDSKILVYTYIGYVTKEITLSGNARIDLQLVSDSKQLSEVVVTGYGQQVKKEYTGSIATVKADKLEDRPLPSVDQMLQGQVAGLQSVGLSGQPGANQQIRIRGIGSINAGANPLYVVDGVILNAGDFSRLSATSNQIAGINGNDIESINVLKDASATSIYGSRGANGVIVINTKKGKAGKTKFSFTTELGETDIAKQPDAGKPLNRDQWLELTREGFVNAGLAPATVEANMIALGLNNGVNTDWVDLVTRNGKQQTYNISASGGTDKTQFYMSGGLYNQEAPIIESSMRRISGSMNLNHKASERVTFGAKLNISNINQNTPSTGGAFANITSDMYFLMPTQNPYNADGSINIDRTGSLGFSGNFNPLYIAENDIHDLANTKILGSVNSSVELAKGLKFNSQIGVDYFNIEELFFYNPFHGDGRTVSGRGYNYYTRVFNWIATNQLNYQFEVPGVKQLKVNATVGYEAQKSKQYNISTNTTGYPPTNELPYSIVASTPVAATGTGSDYTFASILSSLNVSFKEKYNLSGTFRRDGSSRFGANNRYGNFWSVGAAWNAEQEEFIKKFDVISTLKLRASYGVNGNGDIGNYTWRPSFGYGNNYNGQPGDAFNNIGNTDLTWELNKPMDIGMDLGLLNERVTLTVDYYERITSDLLLNRQISRTSGFNSILQNIGEMKNSGWEFTVGGFPIDGKLRWNTSFNISFNKNRVTKLPGGADIIDGAYILREGYDYRTFYVRQSAGVDPQTGDQLYYTDGTKSATTTTYGSAQRDLVGSASPKYFGGFNNTFSFKGFTLDALIVFNAGNMVRDGWEFYMMDGASPLNNKYTKNLERWQKPGDVTNVPKYVYNLQNSSSSFSTRFLYKGDYARLRNVTLGYDFKNLVANKLGLSKASLYLRGTNIFTKTFDKNLTQDPEAGVNSATNLDVPMGRSITMGINLNF